MQSFPVRAPLAARTTLWLCKSGNLQHGTVPVGATALLALLDRNAVNCHDYGH